MRLLYVVQRYGREVAGGAELHCREFATRLAARGHDVSVVTSCALSYVDWANAYDPGTSEIDGVTVHRLPVGSPRDDRFFGPLNSRVVWGRTRPPLHLQRQWMVSQGPYLPGLVPWLESRASGCDAAVFFTYLYYPTWAGLPVASGIVPTVLHPTAHDEPPLSLDLFEMTFRHPTAIAFSTEEEEALVARRFGLHCRTDVIGIGVDLDAPGPIDEAAFREAYGLGDRPYLVFVGRLDPAKGSEELHDFFAAYKRRNPGPLALVMAGDAVRPLPPHPGVVLTGYLDEAAKRSAIAGALALVQPSYFESFSMVLAEAWAQGKAALVQGHCPVLDGQARRSGGGIAYRGFAEFEVAVGLLLENPDAVAHLGAAGRRYVEERYRWNIVLDRYEDFLDRAIRGRAEPEPANARPLSPVPKAPRGSCEPRARSRVRRPASTVATAVVVSSKIHQWLLPCLESVARQVEEVVLVDNGTPGEAASAIGRRLGVLVLRSPKNLGYAAGVNVGLRRANGDLVALLNDDAMADEAWIRTAMTELADPSIAAVAPKLLFARPFAEVHLDDTARFAPGDPRPLGRAVHRVTAGGRDVSLAALLGSGIHRLESGNDGRGRRQWRWTAPGAPIYVPMPDGAEGACVEFDGEAVPVRQLLRLVNNAGSYLSANGHGGDYGFAAPDDGSFDVPGERFGATGAAMVVRRQAFRRLGGFAPEFFAYYEDTDWCWRARLAGMAIRYQPAGIVHHVGGVTSGGPGNNWVRFVAARNRIHTLARNAPLPVLRREILRPYEGRPTSGLGLALATRVPLGLAQRRGLARRWTRTPQEVWARWAGADEQWLTPVASPAEV